MIGRFNSVKILMLSKFIYRPRQCQTKISIGFCENGHSHLKYIDKNAKDQISHSNFKNKRTKLENLHHLNFKTYYKAAVIKIVW